MSDKELTRLATQLKGLAEEVISHLGCGFNETIYQAALAIEMRKKGIEYLKEVNIEIFYKGESVGTDRPDFVLTRVGNLKKPILLELKAVDKLTDGHRLQLKSYCTSLPRNTSPVLKDFAGGILLAFPACDIGERGPVKVIVVDPQFNIISDDQREEDERTAREKEEKKAARKPPK